MREYLAPQGVILLTTPQAEGIHSSIPAGELYAALSGGSHYFLLSQKKLTELGEGAGFKWSYLEVIGMTHVAVFSDAEVNVHNANGYSLQAYYQQKTQQTYADSRIAFNMQMQAWLSDSHRSAADLYQTSQLLEEQLHVLFKVCLREEGLDDFVKRVGDAQTFFEYGKLLPFSLPFYLYKKSQLLHEKQAKNPLFLQLAEFLVLKGLFLDFRNLFLYHDLYKKIKKQQRLQLLQTYFLVSRPLKKQCRTLQQGIPELQTATAINALWGKLKKRLQRAVSSDWLAKNPKSFFSINPK